MSTSTLSRSTSTPSRSKPTGSPRLPSVAKLISLTLLVVTLTILSISLYWLEHHKGRHATVLGDTANPDHMTVTVLIQNIDPSTARVSAQLELRGAGSLVDEHTHDLKEDATLVSNAVTNPTVVSKASERPEFVSVQFALRDGVITDYPLDSYTANFYFHVLVGNGTNQRAVPIRVVFNNIDAFFKMAPTQENSIEVHRGDGEAKTIATPQSLVAATATVKRSTSTIMFAAFIMVFMWCLTIAALIAAWYVASGKLGLFWSALGFLGTLLFALIPLRNAVPGDPPIGSLIDFAAFFIAEGVVSISLIVTVRSRLPHRNLQEAERYLTGLNGFDAGDIGGANLVAGDDAVRRSRQNRSADEPTSFFSVMIACLPIRGRCDDPVAELDPLRCQRCAATNGGGITPGNSTVRRASIAPPLSRSWWRTPMMTRPASSIGKA